MTVYVDDMAAPYGRLVMCHMIASSDEELHAMADRIGVNRKWHQHPPKVRHSHYDICKSKRELAIAAGAIPVTMRQAGCMVARREHAGTLGEPEDAESWLLNYHKQKRTLKGPAE